MKDVLLPKVTQSSNGGPEVTKAEMNHSIVNSVTNDEDDWDGSRNQGGHSIINSVTNDEDEWSEPSGTKHDTFKTSIPSRPCNYGSAFTGSCIDNQKREATMNKIRGSVLPLFVDQKAQKLEGRVCEPESFLFHYGSMMKDQENEQSSTLAYLDFLLQILEEDFHLESHNDETIMIDMCRNKMLKEFSFDELRLLRTKLMKSNDYDIIKVDKQFLMILDILCDEKEASSTGDKTNKRKATIAWSEIVQCYRSCILGMQTLEMTGSHSTIRNRIKERILNDLSYYKNSGCRDKDYSLEAPSEKRLAGSKSKSDDENDESTVVNLGKKYGKTFNGALLGRYIVPFILGVMVAMILGSHPLGIERRVDEHLVSATMNEINSETTEDCTQAGSFTSLEQASEIEDEPIVTERIVRDNGNIFAREPELSSQSEKPHFRNTTDAIEEDSSIVEKRPAPINGKAVHIIGGTAAALTAIVGSLPMSVTAMIVSVAGPAIQKQTLRIWKQVRGGEKKAISVA